MSEKKIAPKTYQKNHVIYSGNLEKTYAVVHRRKIPIKRIRCLMSLDKACYSDGGRAIMTTWKGRSLWKG